MTNRRVYKNEYSGLTIAGINDMRDVVSYPPSYWYESIYVGEEEREREGRERGEREGGERRIEYEIQFLVENGETDVKDIRKIQKSTVDSRQTLFWRQPLGPTTLSNMCLPTCESTALSGSSR